MIKVYIQGYVKGRDWLGYSALMEVNFQYKKPRGQSHAEYIRGLVRNYPDFQSSVKFTEDTEVVFTNTKDLGRRVHTYTRYFKIGEFKAFGEHIA